MDDHVESRVSKQCQKICDMSAQEDRMVQLDCVAPACNVVNIKKARVSNSTSFMSQFAEQTVLEQSREPSFFYAPSEKK